MTAPPARIRPPCPAREMPLSDSLRVEATTTLLFALTVLPVAMPAVLLMPTLAMPTEAPSPTRPTATPPSCSVTLAVSLAVKLTAPFECTVPPLMVALVPDADDALKLLTGVPPRLLPTLVCAVCTFCPAALELPIPPSRLFVEPAVPLTELSENPCTFEKLPPPP